MRVGQNLEEALANAEWICPVCLDICNCSSPTCQRERKGLKSTGQLDHEARAYGWLSVAHYLILTALDDGVNGGETGGARRRVRASAPIRSSPCSRARVHMARPRAAAVQLPARIQKKHSEFDALLQKSSDELEAELKRMRMIRGAVTASRGLLASSQRPSAWWFRIVSPNGAWFRQTIDTADAYLEELS
jgi:hypothetical protein